MAWSAQARAAALAARRRKHHGSATKHIGAKYTVAKKHVKGAAKKTVKNRKKIAQYSVTAVISPSAAKSAVASRARTAAHKKFKKFKVKRRRK